MAESKTAAPAMQGPEAVAERSAARESIPAAASASRDVAGAAGMVSAAADRSDPDRGPAADAVAWAMAHLSEREAVFARGDLLARYARACARSDRDRRCRARSRRAREGRGAACGEPAGRGGLAGNCPDRRRGARDSGAHAVRDRARDARRCGAGRCRGISTRGRSRPGRRKRSS